MLNAFKARLRASVCLTLTAEAWREVIRAFTRMIYKLVRPNTAGARRLGCPCTGIHGLVGNCPYHGRAAREVIFG